MKPLFEQFIHIGKEIHSLIQHIEPVSITVESLAFPETPIPDMYKVISLPEATVQIQKRHNDLEDTMREMEMEEADMSKKITISEKNIQSLKTQIQQLKATVTKQKEDRLKLFVLPDYKKLGFDGISSSMEKGPEVKNTTADDSIDEEKKEKEILQSQIQSLQERVDAFTFNENLWKEYIAFLEQVHLPSQSMEAVVNELSISKLLEGNLRAKIFDVFYILFCLFVV